MRSPSRCSELLVQAESTDRARQEEIAKGSNCKVEQGASQAGAQVHKPVENTVEARAATAF